MKILMAFKQSRAAMRSMARLVHAELIMLLVLCLASPAFAAYESGPVGPYNVSFDMNTTMEYRVIVEAPSSGVTTLGVNFARYNLTIDSADYYAWLILTRYEEPMVANNTTNEHIVYNALLDAGADKPNLYQRLMDGMPGVVGNFRFERQFLGQGQYQEGDLVVAAIYSPDAKVYEDGVYRGRTDCRVISTFPMEVIRDLLYTLHVEVPNDETYESLPVDNKLANRNTSDANYKHPIVSAQTSSPAGKHSCLIGTPGINEFLINWTDSKNYTTLEKHVYDGTVSPVGSSETWLETTFELATYTNENITLGFEIDWHPEKRIPSNVKDIELDPELTATQSDITIQGKKALLVQNKERKVYQGTDEPPSINPASFFVCYYPDDYTEVVVRAPASEWNDSEFKEAISSLKVTPPAGYY